MSNKEEINGYNLSRNWFDFCFENPEKIKPNHTALYFFIIEHCNRLGWKRKFGLPTTMVKDAIGIRSYNTFINTLTDLVEWGLVIMIEKSKNQYSSNIVALSNFNKAPDKALDKALIKHSIKQSESTIQSIDSIIKQLTSEPFNQLNNKQQDDLLNFINNEDETAKLENKFSNVWELYGKKTYLMDAQKEYYNLTREERKIILDHIPKFIKNHKQTKKINYLPSLYNYLLKKRWLEDLPYKEKKQPHEINNDIKNHPNRMDWPDTNK